MEQTLEAAVEFLIPTIVGFVLLLWGRRLFWILGGLVFMVTFLVLIGVLLDPNALDVVARGDMEFNFTRQISDTPTQAQVTLAISLAIGVLISFLVGVVCTIFWPRAASTIVGFAVGAFFLVLTIELFALEMPEPLRRTIVIVGGTIVAFLAFRQPAELTIILSVMLGSKMIVDAVQLNLNSPLSAFVWLIALLVGIVYQTGAWRSEMRKRAERQAAAANLPAPASS